jgi:hypothetical protein
MKRGAASFVGMMGLVHAIVPVSNILGGRESQPPRERDVLSVNAREEKILAAKSKRERRAQRLARELKP